MHIFPALTALLLVVCCCVVVFFFLYSARGGPAGLANKVTRHLGRIGRGGEPPFLGLGGAGGGSVQHGGQRQVLARFSTTDSARFSTTDSSGGLARFSTTDSARGWPRSAPRTAVARLGSARPASPLCPPPPPLQWCSGPEEPGFPHRSLPSAGSRSGHQAGERGRGRGCRVAIGVVGLGGRGATRGKPGF